jgi:hypothetical protein
LNSDDDISDTDDIFKTENVRTKKLLVLNLYFQFRLLKHKVSS